MEEKLTPKLALSRAIFRAAEKHGVPSVKEIALDLNDGNSPFPSKLEILQAELNVLEAKIKKMKDGGVRDYYSPTVIIEPDGTTFLPNKSGWSRYDKFTYDDRRKQFERRLPKGAGIVYVLGVVGNPNLSKIGFTTINAHKRAIDYGKEHDLDLFVYDQVSCSDAKALEQLVHKKLFGYKYEHSNSKEVFAISPKLAISEIRALEPDASPEFLSRELQWFYLQLYLAKAKLAKEQWRQFNELKLVYERNEKTADVKFGYNTKSEDWSEMDEDSAHSFNAQPSAHIAILLQAMKDKLEKQKNEHFHRKIRKVKEEINRKSKGRWKSRYQKQLAKRKQIILLGSITFTILAGALSFSLIWS